MVTVPMHTLNSADPQKIFVVKHTRRSSRLMYQDLSEASSVHRVYSHSSMKLLRLAATPDSLIPISHISGKISLTESNTKVKDEASSEHLEKVSSCFQELFEHEFRFDGNAKRTAHYILL